MSGEKKIVLVVDDEPLVQSTFELLLRKHGFSVVKAQDGNDALAKLERHQVDLVMLDILMPDKDGLETLLILKRQYPGLPVLAISGGGNFRNVDILKVAQKFGADEVMLKATGTRVIIDAVHRLVGTGSEDKDTRRVRPAA